MELWSLLHFLMPHVFRDRKDFAYWFSNPMDSIIEGNVQRNDDLINRLHGIIRPFVLRRLKKDVIGRKMSQDLGRKVDQILVHAKNFIS